MALIDCQVEVCALRLHHIYQKEYVTMHEINIDRSEQKICRDCVDELWMGGNLDKLKNMGKITVYRTY